MKKVYIVISLIICLFLFSCNKDNTISINNEKEVLDLVYNGYLDVDRPEYDDKYNNIDFIAIREDVYRDLDIFKLNFKPSYKLYEALIYKKRYVAGYISDKTINKIIDLHDGLYEYSMDAEKGYSSLYPIYSRLYQEGLLSLEKDKTYFYSFDDSIFLEYDNKKLVFVIEYYEVSLNNDKIITVINYNKGRTIDNLYYYDEAIFYIDYGRCLYQEKSEKKAMTLQEFYSHSKSDRILNFYNYTEKIKCKTISEEEFNLLSSEEQMLYLQSFNEIQKKYLNIDFAFDDTYYFEYDVIKDILINR